MSKYASFLDLDGDDGHAAPLVYQGSHIQPRADDKRGGSIDLAYMPDYCAQPEEAVPFLRLSVGEDPATYHGLNPGYVTVVLDRQQITQLRDAMTKWLDEGEDWE